MPARRKSAAVLQLGASFKHNAGRYAGREREPVDTTALGDAPANLTDAERAHWQLLVDAAPVGVLHKRDRPLLVYASRLGAVIDTRGPVGCKASWLTEYRHCLAKLGLSPSDAPRVQVPMPLNDGSEDAQFWDDFVREGERLRQKRR